MPNWTAPFHLPKFTTEKFEKEKKAYVEKYGYSITVPGLEDIIHFRTYDPITETETAQWKAKDRTNISDQRWHDIGEMKQKKKERYLAMLASPTPEIFRNAGALLTSLDDCQDALTTLSVAGRLAIHFAPRILAKSMLGPVGWIMTAADCINLAIILGRLLTLPVGAKRAAEAFTGGNPFSEKAKIKRAARLAKPWPSISNLIEVAQTTDQVFGYGICLGPIVGFVQDFISGAIRGLMGQKVRRLRAPEQFWPEVHRASRVPKAVAVLAASGLKLTQEEQLNVLGANYLATQNLQQNITVDDIDWALDNSTITEMSAPRPENPLTIEVITEEGFSLEETVGWPHNSNLWASTTDIVQEYAAPAKAFLRATMQEHAHDWYGWLFGNLATGSHFNMMATLEGEDQVEYDYTEKSRFATMLLKAGYFPNPAQPPELLQRLADLLDMWDRQGSRHTLQGFLRACANNGIYLIHM